MENSLTGKDGKFFTDDVVKFGDALRKSNTEVKLFAGHGKFINRQRRKVFFTDDVVKFNNCVSRIFRCG